mmetsp:Transcript_11991/g.31750  ORF Transcript_11991/g.31750 Transcript_11991/m.31750 type:complete len:398 (-) Transcript_11991:196-1389(-)
MVDPVTIQQALAAASAAFDFAKMVYAQCKLAKANPRACAVVGDQARRCESLLGKVTSIGRMERDGAFAADLLEVLVNLRTELQRSLELVNFFTAKGQLKRFIWARTYDEDFRKAAENLEKFRTELSQLVGFDMYVEQTAQTEMIRALQEDSKENRRLLEDVHSNQIDQKEVMSEILDKVSKPQQWEVRIFYDNGQGVGKNEQQAVQWYGKAADQGHAQAQYNLEGPSSLQNKQQITLRSVHWQGQLLYVPDIDYNPKRQQVCVWKREAQSDVISKAQLVVEVVPGTSRIRLQTRKYNEAGQYVYCPAIDGPGLNGKRGEVLVWKGEANADVLEKAEFEVEPVDGHSGQIRLRSVKWAGAYLYVPAIDYNGDRRQVLIWKGEPLADVRSKALFQLSLI